MGIFRRGKNSDPADSDEALGGVDGVDPADGTAAAELEADDHDALTDEDDAGETTAPAAARTAAAVERTGAEGPFDASEVDDDDGRLDLGALRIMGVPGMELRLEIDETAD